MNVVVVFLGLVLALVSGFCVWWLVHFLIGGILAENWLIVVGGGILTYVFVGVLIGGIITGIVLIILGLDDDSSFWP